jgi:hypothetical protein
MTTTNPITATATTVGPVPAAPAAGRPQARADDAAVTTLLNCYLRETGAEVGGGSAFLPVHPWQARRLLERPQVRELLARGVEVHRLLEAGLGAELAARFPRFAIVRDPAWATVRRPGGPTESGFEVIDAYVLVNVVRFVALLAWRLVSVFDELSQRFGVQHVEAAYCSARCGSSTLPRSVRRPERLSLLRVVGRRGLVEAVGGGGPAGQQAQGVQ